MILLLSSQLMSLEDTGVKESSMAIGEAGEETGEAFEESATGQKDLRKVCNCLW